MPVEVVSFVVFSFVPVYMKFLGVNFVFQPMVAHIPSFGAFRFDVRVDEPVGGAVVNFDVGGSLRVSHFMECGSNRYCDFAIVEECTGFCFGSG